MAAAAAGAVVATGAAAPPDTSYDIVRDLAVQADGRIVAVGDARGVFGVARYSRSGRLDRSFGTRGKVTTEVGGDNDPAAAAIQGDGKIVVVGDGASDGFALVRYRRDGRLDTGFGDRGIAQPDLTPECGGWGRDVAIQPDRKIVVAGLCSGDTDGFVLARYTPAGRLDPTFGTDGSVVTDFGSDRYDNGRALALQADGKIIVVGESTSEAVGRRDVRFALARFLPTGGLDAGFGRGGKVLGGPGEAGAVAVQPDGKIIVAGDGVARYAANGSVDHSFGTDGTVSGVGAGDVAIQRDGRIILAGAAGKKPDYDLAVLRLSTSGRVDRTFGSRGTARTDIGGRSWDVAGSLALEGARIVAAGFTFPRGGQAADFALTRYTTRGRLDRSFGTLGRVVTDFGPAATRVIAFTATATTRGVLLRWRTASEVDARGFNVYRELRGRRVRVNRRLLRSKGSALGGAAYSLLDRPARRAVARYRLQLVGRDGRRTFYPLDRA